MGISLFRWVCVTLDLIGQLSFSQCFIKGLGANAGYSKIPRLGTDDAERMLFSWVYGLARCGCQCKQEYFPFPVTDGKIGSKYALLVER
jgi:hypothetical protein